MKRAGRWLLDGTAALSLLLALVVAVIWISHLLPGQWSLAPSIPLRRTAESSLAIRSGGFNFVYIDRVSRIDPPVVGPVGSTVAAVMSFQNQFPAPRFDVAVPPLRIKTVREPVFGFRPDGRLVMSGSRLLVGIPYGLLLVLLLTWPLVRWHRTVIRWARAKLVSPPGCCKVCGYDLRASPDRCPECGAAANPPNRPKRAASLTIA